MSEGDAGDRPIAKTVRADSVPGATVDPALAMIGQVVGNYRIDSLLGQGGMGVVYVGRHTLLDNRVAIKFLHAEMTASPEVVNRFVNEAKAASSIRHAGIVHVFDFGRHGSGATYCVMEFLEGESLAARLARRPRLPSEEILRIGSQIADALAAAHAAGIVHRDLKPDNIFLVPDAAVPGGERVKILDFGIAKLATDDNPASLRTRTGMVMGTPFYMSPEQCRGAGKVDSRADIYSLGCLLFEMACGQVPFRGEGVGEILGAHQFVPPPSPRSFNPDLPAAAESFLLRTLAKDPGQRPQTMRDLATELAVFVPAPPGTPRGTAVSTTLSGSAGERATPPPGAAGSRRLVLAAAAAILLAAGGLTIGLARRGATPARPGLPPVRHGDAGPAVVAIPTGPADATPTNKWIRVEPPTKGRVVLLGLEQPRPGQQGFLATKFVAAPTHAFELQQHEVTWGELDAWIAAAPSARAVTAPDWVDPTRRKWYPTTNVPWAVADAYCRALGGGANLPSEEQWEYAGRGAARRPYPWGADGDPRELACLYRGPDATPGKVMGCAGDRTPGDAATAIYDLTGNAFEWTASTGRDDEGTNDGWATTGFERFFAYRGLPIAAPPPATMPVEGLAWRDNLCESGACTAAARATLRYLGFRCARPAR